MDSRMYGDSSTSEIANSANGVRCLKGEIHRVLSVLRSNSRWASTARFSQEVPLHAENPLVRSFKKLLLKLESSDDLLEIDSVAYLSPFLSTITAPETSSMITTGALSSINKFLIYGFLNLDSPRAAEAINLVAAAATSCKFEPVSTKDTETTLMTLLEVLENTVRCSAGILLSDDSVWGLVQCCHTISKIEKSSHLLRRMAESTLGHIILHVFSGADRIALAERTVATAASRASPTTFSDSFLATGHIHTTKGYGSTVLTRTLSWLTSLLGDASSDLHAIIAALESINIILETGGPALSEFPTLVYVAQAELCKFLIPVSRSSDLAVLAPALRVVFNLFISMRQHLKVQLEVFFSSVHLYLADNTNASVSPAQRELALESLLEFCREPALMLDFYVNYDCDVACANLYESVVKLLCRVSQPIDRDRLTSLNTIALEGLLALLALLLPKSAGEQHPSSDANTWADKSVIGDTGSLHARKVLKKKYMLAAHKFNADQKHWIPFVQELGLLPSPADHVVVAKFLRECPGLDQSLVGLYISEPDDPKHAFQTSVRRAFVETFDFSGLRIDEALRLFLESFRLPGEAQKIERIVQAFAERMWLHSPAPMTHQDTPFVLAYSIIMLNTDLHNKTVKKKMTEQQFINNNRGIDNGHDVPREYLTAIYNSIAEREIILRADTTHFAKVDSPQGSANTDGDAPRLAPTANDSAITGAEKGDGSIAVTVGAHWEGVMRRQNAVSAYTSAATHGKRGASHALSDMCAILLDPLVRCLGTFLDLTTDVQMLRKLFVGLRNCAAIARQQSLRTQADAVVITLCRTVLNDISSLNDLLHDESTRQYAQAKIKQYLVRNGMSVSDDVLAAVLFDDQADAVEDNVARVKVDYDTESSEDELHVAKQTRHKKRMLSSTRARNHSAAVSDEQRRLLPASEGSFAFRRTLLAIKACFDAIMLAQDVIDESWKYFVEVVVVLTVMDCFPAGIIDLDDIRSPSGLIIASALQPVEHQSARGSLDTDNFLNPLNHIRQMLMGSLRLRRLVTQAQQMQDDWALSAKVSDEESTPASSEMDLDFSDLASVDTQRIIDRPKPSAIGRSRSARSASPPRAKPRAPSESLLGSLVSMFSQADDVFALGEEDQNVLWSAIAADVSMSGTLRTITVSCKNLATSSALNMAKALLFCVQSPDSSMPTFSSMTSAANSMQQVVHSLLCSAVCVELLVELVLLRGADVAVLLPILFAACSSLHELTPMRGDDNVKRIADQARQYIQERCVVAVLRIAVRLFSIQEDKLDISYINAVTSILHHMSALPDHSIADHAGRITSGLAIVLRLGPASSHIADSTKAEDLASTIFPYLDTFLRALHRCKPYFYAAGGVWDILTYMVTMQTSDRLWGDEALPAERIRVLLRFHKHLLGHTLHELSTYVHVHTKHSVVAGLAAAVLMSDDDDSAAGPDLAGQSDVQDTPNRKATTSKTPNTVSSKGALGRYRTKKVHNSMVSPKMSGISSSQVPEPRLAISLSQTRTYQATLRKMVEDEPMADLREFATQAVLRLVEHLSHRLCPAAAESRAFTELAACQDSVDECWLMILNWLRAGVIHVSTFGEDSVRGHSALTFPDPDAESYSAMEAAEFSGIIRIRPHLLRAYTTVLHRLLLAPARCTIQAREYAPPINAGVWVKAWHDCILPVTEFQAGYVLRMAAAHPGPMCSLEEASQVISSFNLAPRSIIQNIHVNAPLAAINDSWLQCVSHLLAAAQRIHQVLLDPPPGAEATEGLIALQTIKDASLENISTVVTVLSQTVRADAADVLHATDMALNTAFPGSGLISKLGSPTAPRTEMPKTPTLIHTPTAIAAMTDGYIAESRGEIPSSLYAPPTAITAADSVSTKASLADKDTNDTVDNGSIHDLIIVGNGESSEIDYHKEGQAYEPVHATEGFSTDDSEATSFRMQLSELSSPEDISRLDSSDGALQPLRDNGRSTAAVHTPARADSPPIEIAEHAATATPITTGNIANHAISSVPVSIALTLSPPPEEKVGFVMSVDDAFAVLPAAAPSPEPKQATHATAANDTNSTASQQQPGPVASVSQRRGFFATVFHVMVGDEEE